jgi:tRNA(fMet)-specific endonuclease VapC
MICTDSSFLIDYLTETDNGPAAAFLEAHEDEPFYVSAIALFEIYCGPADDSAAVPVEKIAGLVDWLEPLPFTDESAREAAHIRRELRGTERSLGTGDVLIAADARRIGGTLVTADADFTAVDGLSVATFR